MKEKWIKLKSPFIFTGSSMEFWVLKMAEKLVDYLTFSYACYYLIKFCFWSKMFYFQIIITIIMSFKHDLFYYILSSYSCSYIQFLTVYFTFVCTIWQKYLSNLRRNRFDCLKKQFWTFSWLLSNLDTKKNALYLSQNSCFQRIQTLKNFFKWT